MKKVLAFLIMSVFLAGVGYAATPSTLRRNVWNAEQKFKQGLKSGQSDEFYIDNNGTIQTTGGGEYVEIPADAWRAMLYTADNDAQAKTSRDYVKITSTTEPNLANLTTDNGRALETEVIQWSDGDGDWLETWFHVPATYKGTDGAFKFEVSQTDAINARDRNYIQYRVLIAHAGQDITTLTERTPAMVVIPFNANQNTPQTVTLYVVSKQAVSPNNVIANSWIRLRYRRFDVDVAPGADGGDSIGTSTGNMNVWRTYWDPTVPNS